MLLLFDLDNTLLDRNRAFELYIGSLLKEGQSLNSLTDFFTTLFALDDAGQGSRKTVCSYIISRLELTMTVAELQEDMYRIADFVEPDPQVHECLNLLGRRHQLGLITNGSSLRQRQKIQRAQLGSFFEHIVISEEAGYEKPDQRIFHHCLALFGYPDPSNLPKHAVMIGHDWQRDVLGARNAGLQAHWINSDWPQSTRRGNLVLPHLKALLAMESA